MDNNTVTKLLTDFRSYKFALMNLGVDETVNNPANIRPIYSERVPKHISRYDTAYDRERYTRIVTMVESAVNYVLNDDQRTVIMRKYLERNTMNLDEIANILHKHRTTVGRWHREAINKLSKALLPISKDYMEISNIDHMFDPNWTFKEPA